MSKTIKSEKNNNIINYSYLRVGEEIFRHTPSPILRRLNRIKIINKYYWPKHYHNDEIELLLCHSGSYSAKLNNNPVEIKAGQALLLQKGITHVDCCNAKGEITSINFCFEEPEKGLAVMREGLSVQSYILNIMLEEIDPMLKQIEKESSIADGISSFIQDGLVKCILWRVIRSIPLKLLEPRWASLIEQEYFVEMLHGYFECNLKSTPSVDIMAKSMNMSRRYFEKKCRQIMGDSPASAFRRYKMERANDLLQGSNLTISQVAFSLGFSDQFQFSRCFKKNFGVSPKNKQ